ncbi:hypothetical protein B7P43_G09175 [Cryptotermes secundus]|uniref:MD-2-related lipid-recognition domain-containing protein n=1 Tax=Cryptotermes secundus TaxID=105785 RepID=A0A2J7QGX3_9NEOP|nr:uncharacterized protein LOC111867642 [Cryptotermes secundus]PNF27838.1 hypothetical protein B7P43_G09175 [Cryptotermes secundus]
MKLINAVICALVILLHQQAQADEDPSYEIQVTNVTPFADTKEYVDLVEGTTGEDGSKTTFSLKATVIKDVPEDAICQTTFYKKQDGEFKKNPFGIVPTPCCDLLFQNEIFKHIMETQNVPKACPFKKGTYSVDNYAFDTNRYKNAPRGEYRANFTAYLPSESKPIIYGVDLTFKIVDKS